MNVRPMLVKVHLWVGLVAAPVLLAVGLTGALLVVEGPITDRLNATTALVEPRGAPRSISQLLASVQQTHPGAELLAVQLPSDRWHSAALVVSAEPEEGPETVLVDPYTARVLGVPPSQPPFFQRVRQLHRQLLLGRTGNTVVVWTALALAFLAVTGPVVWWPRRRVGVRWERAGWRRVLDLHALLGAISCAFLFMFAVTGAVVHWDDGVQSFLGRLTGNASPRPPRNLGTSKCGADALLDADRLIAAAMATLPGARVTALQLPGARVTALKRADAGPSVARLSLKFPEDHTPNGRSILLMDRCTGRAAFTIDTRSAPLSYLYPREWNRELHTGDIFGWPTLLLAFVFSLSLCVMGVTGPLVWLMKTRNARSRA
jgi:uncharacterized iron-regulated membrane protein